jgi:hypothetical protein
MRNQFAAAHNDDFPVPEMGIVPLEIPTFISDTITREIEEVALREGIRQRFEIDPNAFGIQPNKPEQTH